MNTNNGIISKKHIITFIILGVLIIALLVLFGDYQQILDNLQKINLAIIPLLILCTLVNYIIRAFKWEYFLRLLNIRVPLLTSALVFFSGLSMAITPGKVGEVLKSYLLKQSNQVRMSKSVVVVVAERLTDVLSLVILSLLGLSSFFMYWYALVIIPILVFILFLLLRNKKAYIWFRVILAKIPILKRYVPSLDEILSGSRTLFTYKAMIVAVLLSVVSWFFECLALMLLLKDLGYPIPVFEATFVFSFSSIFGAIFVLPGGLGAAEISFVGLLMAIGVPRSIGSIATIIIRVCTLWFGVALGYISLLLFQRIIQRKQPS